MSPEEVDRLAVHLGLTTEETLKRHCRKLQGKVSLKETKTEAGLYDCVFLKTIEEGGKTKRVCGIYHVRPLQCRTWPFWDGLLASEDAWKRAGKMCPGLGRGKHYPLEKIESLRTAKDWPAEAPGSGAGE